MNKGAKLNTLGHWQPVELLKKRRGMSAFGFFENQPGTPILDSLKTGNVLLGHLPNPYQSVLGVLGKASAK